VTCREMEVGDCAGVAALLTRGFSAWRTAAFWERALARLAGREPPEGLPRLGYVLEADGAVVGVLLLIASESDRGERRCNVSSWYVEPAFSLYGTLLVRRALRLQGVTYVNVTPAPETWDLLAAQGYRRYSVGRSFAVPALARRGATGRVIRVRGPLRPGPDLSEHEVKLLQDHAQWGCLSLVAAGPEGRVPFVFGRRWRKGVIPFAYLLHCRGIDSFTAHARPLGRYLLRYGIGLVVADAEAKVAGMPGWFQDGFPKFYRGAEAPGPHDLAYTERAVFGV
jgi:hypothetical protein